MRTIKFRAWNPDSKKMTYIPNYEGSYLHLGGNHGFIKDLDWYVSNGQSSCAYSDRSTLMQFTGLLDKNGKEIYEGDIVKSPECDNQQEVKYCDIQESDDMTAPGIGFQFNTNPQDMEIIGNIYENPELIK